MGKSKFWCEHATIGELSFKTDNLGRKSLSPAARPCYSSMKETPLREQIRLLKQELALKDEQLSHYQTKAAAWKGVIIKNKKKKTKRKNTAGRSHAVGKESSISYSDMKRYEDGPIF